MANFSVTFAEGSDAYTFPGYDQSLSDNFGNAVPRTERLADLDGGFDAYLAEDAPNEIGNINLAFKLVAETREEMQALIDDVRRLKHLGKRKLFLQPQGTAAARWCYARINNIAVSRRPSEHTDLNQTVQIAFQVSDPHWMGAEESQAITASGTSTDALITNDGNAPALARVVVTCGAGETAENVKIRRMVSTVVADEMAYTGVLIASDELVLDAQAKSVLLNDAVAYDAFAASNPNWFRLMPGENTVRVIMANAGDDATVTVYWSNTYR